MSTPRKFALVGAGVIGKHHGLVMSELADRLELVAVADVVRERAEELATARGGRPYASLTEALNAEDVDVVVVCTPTGRPSAATSRSTVCTPWFISAPPPSSSQVPRQSPES